MRESKAVLTERAAQILDILETTHPEAKCALDYRNPFELVAATILSAQCTDERVNQVTPALFRRYPDAKKMAGAKPEDLEAIIRPTGFFRSKSKSLLGCATALTERHGGQVPRTMDEMTALPGVGRKTASVVLGHAYDIAEGIAVDTHVTRLSGLLGLSEHTDPVKIERDLMAKFPRKHWTNISHLLILHGRRVCIARRPKCAACILNDICPSAFSPEAAKAAAVKTGEVTEPAADVVRE